MRLEVWPEISFSGDVLAREERCKSHQWRYLFVEAENGERACTRWQRTFPKLEVLKVVSEMAVWDDSSTQARLRRLSAIIARHAIDIAARRVEVVVDILGQAEYGKCERDIASTVKGMIGVRKDG